MLKAGESQKSEREKKVVEEEKIITQGKGRSYLEARVTSTFRRLLSRIGRHTSISLTLYKITTRYFPFHKKPRKYTLIFLHQITC